MQSDDSLGSFHGLIEENRLLKRRLIETERLLAERDNRLAALRDTEEKYFQLFETEMRAILLIEEETGRILEANAGACIFYGCSRHELLNMTERELCARPSRIHGGPSKFINFYQRTDGTILPVEAANRYFSLQGRRVHFATIRMAANHSVDEEREQTQSFFRRIIDSDPALIYVKDKQGRIVLANCSLAEFFGIHIEELIGKTVFDCTQDKEAAERMCRDDLKILSGKIDKIDRECRIRDKSGCDQWVHMVKIPMKDKEDNVEHLIGVSVIITKHKMMEDAIAQRERELYAKTRELEDTNTALRVLLERMEQDKRELIENVIVNLQEMILPCVQKLEASRLDKVQKAYVDLLESGLAEIGSPFLKRLPQRHTDLSTMEVRIAKLIRSGKGSKEIAEILAVSLNTVMTHRYHLRAKLGVKGRKVNLRSHLNSIEF